MKYNSKYRANNDKEGEYKLNAMYFLIFLVISILVFIVGVIISLNVNYIFRSKLTVKEINTIRILMLILTTNTSITFLVNVFISNIAAYEKFVVLKAVSIINTVLQPIITLPLLYLGYKSIAITIVNISLGFVAFGIDIWYCYKKLNFKMVFKDFDKQVFKDILIFSSFMFINIITDQITSATDKFLLGIFSGTAAVAIYNVGAQFNNYYLSFSSAISNVFTPRVNSMIAKNVSKIEIDNLFIKIGRIQFIILMLPFTGYIFFGQRFVDYLSGPGYESAFYIGLFLLISIIVPSMQNIGIEILKAKDLHKTRSVVYLFIAIGNILISIPLCIKYKGIGCALGTLLTMTLGTVFFMNYYYYKKAGIDIPRFWNEILKCIPSLIIPSIFGIFIRKYTLTVKLIIYVFFIMIYTIIYLISSYYLAMNTYEKTILKDIIQKFRIKNKCRVR